VELRERLARLEGALAQRDVVIEALRAENAELRRRSGLTSRNSSKPPSSDGPAKPAPRSRRERTDRAPGKQPGEPGFTLRQVPDPDEVVVHRPRRCAGCGDALADAAVTSVERRQVFDLPDVRLRVTEHRVEHRRCWCGVKTMAAVPDGVAAPAQYGPRVRAIAGYLVGYQHLPYERAAETLADLLGVGMSMGTLVGIMTTTAQRLTPFLQRIRTLLAAAEVAHFDPRRVGGGRPWWCCSHVSAGCRSGCPG
jgi:transposase